MTKARRLTAADITAATEALVSAFSDDPVMQHLVPPRRRSERLGLMFATLLRHDVRVGHDVWTSPGLESVAVWRAPNEWKASNREVLELVFPLVRAFGVRTSRALRTFGAVESAHPAEPHWYLSALGTAQPHQGRGFGAAVLRPILERCDEEGLPAYLESSNPRNVPFYRRHGFVERREIKPPDGPPLMAMWREPRPS